MIAKEFARRIARELGRRLCAKGEHWWSALRPRPEFVRTFAENVGWTRQCIRPDCGQWEHRL